MPIGPSLPPHLAHLATSHDSPNGAQNHLEEGDEEEDDFGPALPPEIAAKRSKPVGPARPAAVLESPSPPRIVAGPSRPGYTSPSPPRIVGPSRPGGASGPSKPPVGPARPPASPPSGSHRHPGASNRSGVSGGHGGYGEEEDSDDEIGPRPDFDPSGDGVKQKSAVEEFMERERRRAELLEEEKKPKKLERQEWMLAPPTGGVLGSIDPLRKRPSTFNRTNKEPEEVSHLWTESPAEKAQRLKDEAAGIKRQETKKAVSAEDAEEAAKKRKRDREIREEVERHNKSSRGPSLLEKHTSKRSGEEQEDKAIWDHARDMGVTGRMLTDIEREKKIKYVHPTTLLTVQRRKRTQ